MKKFLAILVAVMILAASMSALAADHTISTTSDTHTYEIYQIFTGEKSGDQLVNLKYGKNAKTGTEGDSVSAEDMEALDAIAKATYSNDQEKITALTPYVTLSNPIAVIGMDQEENSASLPEGYYIIKDLDDSLDDPETYTLYLFKVLDDDLEIEPKSGTTTVDKTVTETNDTTGATAAGQNGADYDEGDPIPYELTITLAENVTSYKTYTVTLTDTLSDGLTPPDEDDIDITFEDANGDEIEAVSGITVEGPTVQVSGQVITVTFTASNGENAIGTAGAAFNKAVIKVNYNAVLNDKAKVGVEGNPNTYTITYSNNPNGDDTGKTPDQEVKVFTYELDLTKTDGNGEPLKGAGFTLYKVVTDKVSGAVLGSEIATTLGTSIKTDKLDANTYYVPVTMTETEVDGKVKHTTDTTIDAGSYVLIETTVPAGYNAYPGENITITSTIDDDGNLTGLTATPATLSIKTSKEGVSTSVMNQSGAVLPSTGGIGTTIFYVGGSVLVLLAVILLVTKRRMNAGK